MSNLSAPPLLIESAREDEAGLADAVAEGMGACRLSVVRSVAEARAILVARRFDLLLVEHRLCDGTAFDLSDAVASQSVIVLTGPCDDESGIEALRLSARDGLIKGAGRESLALIPLPAAAALRQSEMERQLRTEIADREQTERALRRSEQWLRAVIENEPECVKVVGTDGRVLQMNASGLAMLEADTVEEVNARGLASFVVPEDQANFAALHQRVIGGERGLLEFEVIGLRGTRRWLETHAAPISDPDNHTTLLLGITRDITALKEHGQKLEYIAHYDALTRLPNRVLLADRLHQSMAQCHRRGQPLAVVYIDLDGFKAINDRYGHEAGDRMLIALATSMREVLREGDTLARIGGDEFVAVLVDLEGVDARVPIISRLLAAAAQLVNVDGLMLRVSASLGVTFYPDGDEVDADQLLRRADQAMYQAKLAGKNRYHVFDAVRDSSIRSHHESVDRIRRALRDRELVLHYQPKVDMCTGAVIGAEALVRWQHPERGLLLPAMFLPTIEDDPLAVEVGEWVIDSALSQIESWREVGLCIPVSVNVCARQLQQAGFVDRLRALLAAHPRVAPGDLEMEVLETSALRDLAQVSNVIGACGEIGVSFTLDDFGTGYSSLTYLKRLPVARLKIDQSFVRDMLNDPDDLAILEGVLGMATAFRRDVVAEGVENMEQGAMLLQLGCQRAQGYGIARPMPAEAMPAWSAAWRNHPSWGELPVVSRDDLPLLFASARHRAWIAVVENQLKGGPGVQPPLDHHQCHIGRWLDGKGLARHGRHPAFHSIERLHRAAHALVAELLALQAGGKGEEALARMGDLHAIGEALTEKFKSLCREAGAEGDA